MSLTITTLIENTPDDAHTLQAEHGLSMLIETDNYTLLFDTGQSGAFLDNAGKLGKKLSNLDYVIISHGHYDHSGGLCTLLNSTSDFRLVTGKGFFNKKYGEKDGIKRYIGNAFDEQLLKEKHISRQEIEQSHCELLPGVHVITNFPRIYPDETINQRFTIEINGETRPDPFNDEILLALDMPQGLLVLLGCSHPGLKNMLGWTSKVLNKPIYGVIGGTHLVEADEERIDSSLAYLDSCNLQILGISHCTGQAAMDKLAASNSIFFHNKTGSSLKFNRYKRQGETNSPL